MEKYHYEARQEECENYGTHYISYAIFAEAKEAGEADVVCHDVTTNQEEAAKLCILLNAHELEPEQARYVIEDYIMERYFMEV